MLTSQRKSLIVERLARDGQVVAKALSHELGASEDTIRRDLRELALEGRLLRVHGGAMPISPTVAPLADRRGMATGEKSALGAAGADLIRDGMTVFIDGGTTNLELVSSLRLDMRLTVVTHSPSIAAALEARPLADVVLIGGKLYRHSMVTLGAAAAEAISRIRVDLFFLGVTGVHPEEGLTTGDMEEAAIKRQIMSRAAETIVLATSDKLGAVSPFKIADLADISTLIIGRDAGRVAELEASGTQVIRAD